MWCTSMHLVLVVPGVYLRIISHTYHCDCHPCILCQVVGLPHPSPGYRIVGSHSGVKLCRWTKSMLRGRGGCYKHTFYGIESHRCMESTPSLACANKCVFCWRHHTNPVGTEWKWQMDEPGEIVRQALENHYQMIKQFRGTYCVQWSMPHVCVVLYFCGTYTSSMVCDCHLLTCTYMYTHTHTHTQHAHTHTHRYIHTHTQIHTHRACLFLSCRCPWGAA